MRLLLAGISTRAVADSAARAGFDVTALDAFADLDQHTSVRAVSLGEGFSPESAARDAQAIDADAVAYGANFENDPDAVDALARGRALWGNSSDVLRRVRDPQLLSQTLRRRGFPSPRVVQQLPLPADQSLESSASTHQSPQSPQSPIPNPHPPRWLLKRYASGGGQGVRGWRADALLPRGSYLQEFVDGTPCSIVFIAARGGAVPIGFCRQLIGDAAFGSSGYRYCGNVLTAAGEDDRVVETACAVAAAVSDEFALVGVNGIDLIVRDDAAYAIEVNPRWCASMELVERACEVSVFGMHAAACRHGRLPEFDLARARRRTSAIGKAVVFARRDVTVGDTRRWSSARGADVPDLRDIPPPDTFIRAGHPVCTVFAAGVDSADCRAELARKAELVYALIDRHLTLG